MSDAGIEIRVALAERYERGSDSTLRNLYAKRLTFTTRVSTLYIDCWNDITINASGSREINQSKNTGKESNLRDHTTDKLNNTHLGFGQMN